MAVSTSPNTVSDISAAERRKRLREGIENAELLVAFASRNALNANDLEEKDLDTLILSIAQARAAFDAGGLDAGAEAKLFSDLRHLAAAFLPVTASSIRDSSEAVGGPRRYFCWGDPISHAAAAVRRFSIFSAIALAILLWTQIIWLAGYDVVGRWRALGKEKVESEEARKNRDIQQDALINIMKGWWDRFGITMLSPNASPAPSVRQNSTAEFSPTPASDSPSSSLDPASPSPEAGVAAKPLAGASPPGSHLSEITPTPTAAPAESQPQSPPGAMPPSSEQNEFSPQKENIRVAVAVETEVNIIQTYVLPLFYGLLGSCAFVLRQLGLEIRGRTFRRELGITYWLHIFLGALSGLAVGWFLRPEGATEGLIRGLTPFALSFLAGYSVEVLFSAMDRLVAAFGSARTDKETS
jgi:hypothetical protein